jgi:Mn2+/Fe2+ NRAMP family transporter
MVYTILRFVAIFVIIIVAILLGLAVGGVLSSSQVWNSVQKVAELAAIVFVASGLVTLIAKTNKK